MTASDTTATIKKGNSEPSFDKTAQRILNLFFVLNSSPEPLTTEQIVLDSDLGYGSGNIINAVWAGAKHAIVTNCSSVAS